MKIGLLEAGRPPETLIPRHGAYPAMFRRLLEPAMPAAAFADWAVLDGDLPPGPEAADGFLVSGSAFGAYDDAAWIAALEDFLKRAVEAGRPVFGICFGHQLLAQALGGTVRKAEVGWGVGVHDYDVVDTADWMTDIAPGGRFSTIVTHQDQVIEPPPGARLLARSDFCPNAMLECRPHAVGLQSHPEMGTAYAADLYEARRERIGDARIDAALASLSDKPVHADLVARWIARFFHDRIG